MPNTYFRFKQFSVNQEHCAMKVTTDACLFGAVVADAFGNTETGRALDIGTGTGLLSLMLAQQLVVDIDAVEIEEAAARQAQQNFDDAPWADRLRVIHTDITRFDPGPTYPLIFSNPPFFENDLRSEEAAINAARHDTGLKLDVLFECVKQLLSADGHWVVLLPERRIDDALREAAARDLHLYKRIDVRQTPAHDHFRGILFFSQVKKEYTEEEVVIRNGDHAYSPEFTRLLKDYYLYL